MEELLHLLHTVLGQVDRLFLFIDNVISGLFDLLSHDGIHLGKFAAGLAPLQLSCQDIAGFIELCRLAALSGNDQRRPCLVDQNRVHLVDDRVMEPPLHQLLLVDDHIVAEIIKSQFIVGHIGDITVILLTALVIVHAVEHDAHRQSQEFMYLAHPLRVTLC